MNLSDLLKPFAAMLPGRLGITLAIILGVSAAFYGMSELALQLNLYSAELEEVNRCKQDLKALDESTSGLNLESTVSKVRDSGNCMSSKYREAAKANTEEAQNVLNPTSLPVYQAPIDLYNAFVRWNDAQAGSTGPSNSQDS